MVDDKVGYKKPPKKRQFKSGQSGNPDGRPRRRPAPLTDLINDVMEGAIEYRERDRTKVTTRRELGLRLLVDRAAKGEIKAAEAILAARVRAERQGGASAKVILVENTLPES